MKQSYFTKNLSIQGSVRTVTGRVKVHMNSGSSIVTGTHAATHDDYTTKVYTHSITSDIDGVPFADKTVSNEAEVIQAVEEITEITVSHMSLLAEAKPVKSFLEKMRELGFTNTELKS